MTVESSSCSALNADNLEDEKSSDEQPEFKTVAGLKERGWTAASIKKFLGEPDRFVPNPYYRSASAMRLYYFERVLEAERTTEVKAALHKSAARRLVRLQVAQEQAWRLLDQVKRMRVKVVTLLPEKLLKAAIQSYNDWYSDREDWEPASPDSDPAFLARIQVNYVRHRLTRYDAALEKVAGKVGVREAEDVIREKVYAAIKATYPEFVTECDAQLERRRMLEAMM